MRPRDKAKRQRKRIILMTSIALLAIVLVILYQLLSNISNSNLGPVGKPISSSLYKDLYKISSSAYYDSDPNILRYFAGQNSQEYISNEKPIVVYIGAEYCPYCAFIRWPLVIALMRFGNFSGLEYMRSGSSPEVYPDTATFSFRNINYQSNYIIFEAYELQDRSGAPLERLPSNYSDVFNSHGSTFPFLSFANRYILSGSIYNPDLMQGKNWTQIVSIIGSNTTLGHEVKVVANAITAVICKLTNNNPEGVCSNVSNLTEQISFSSYGESTSLITGIPNINPSIWAIVQYGQTEWMRRSST